jgi:hypothetical protein
MMTFIDSLSELQNPYRLAVAYGLIALTLFSALALLYRYRRAFSWYRNISSYYHGRRLRIVSRRGRRLYVYLWEIQNGDHCTGTYHPPSSRWVKRHGPTLKERLRGAVDESLRTPPLPREPERQDETRTEPEDEETEENIYQLAACK